MPLGRYTLARPSLGSAIWCFASRRRSAGASEAATTRSTTTSATWIYAVVAAGVPRCGCLVATADGPLDMTAVPMIPLVDVKAQYAPLIPELKQRLGEVLESRAVHPRPERRRPSRRRPPPTWASRQTIGVANGTDAIVLVLDAMGIGPGDEVICPAFTFYATAEAIVARGATPVFADIDPRDAEPRPRGRRRADHAARRRRSCRCTSSAARRRSTSSPRSASRSSRTPPRPSARRASRTTGVASTFSFFPTKNLFALGDGGLVAVTDDELGERIRMLRFHGSRDKKDFELVGYNSRLDELQAACAARLPAAARRVERARGARPPRATRELGLGELCRGARPTRPGHVYHLFVVPLAASATGSRAALAEARRSRCASYYVTPLHLQPALALSSAGSTASLPETERPPRENLALPLWAGIDEATQERVVERRPRSRLASGRRADLAADQPAPALAARRRRVPVRGRLVPRLPAPLRPEGPALLRHALRPDDLDRDRDPARRLRPLRLLQPLVALRLDARHVGRRRAASPSRASSPSLVVYFVDPVAQVRLPRSVAVMDWLLLLAFVAGRAHARADADRAADRPRPRRPRQGGDRRRRRRRRPADRQGDAAEPVARLHADRPRRRRPAEEEPAPARRPRVRHDRGAAADPRRQPPGRGADRDPVRLRRGAPADRRHRARGGHPGEDAARHLRADLRRPRPRRPDPPGPGRGRARPRAGRGRPATRSRRTSPTRRCSSPAPAARSAPSSAARSPASAASG